jgi:hypothetical protein
MPKASSARTDLPPEVLALARRVGVSAGASARLVRLTQSGEMWLRPGAKPLSFKAHQICAFAEVGFLWHARFRMCGLSMQVIDYLVGGEGGFDGRLLSAFPVVRMIPPLFRSRRMIRFGRFPRPPSCPRCILGTRRALTRAD